MKEEEGRRRRRAGGKGGRRLRAAPSVPLRAGVAAAADASPPSSFLPSPSSLLLPPSPCPDLVSSCPLRVVLLPSVLRPVSALSPSLLRSLSPLPSLPCHLLSLSAALYPPVSQPLLSFPPLSSPLPCLTAWGRRGESLEGRLRAGRGGSVRGDSGRCECGRIAGAQSRSRRGRVRAESGESAGVGASAAFKRGERAWEEEGR
eukprot:2863726-Rhodomonas_salina.1